MGLLLCASFIKNFNIAKNLIKHQVSPMNENIVAELKSEWKEEGGREENECCVALK